LDSAFAEHAYEDKPFPIGNNQTISQPFTVAYQTQILDVKPGNKVLEIGTGSGYQACVLSEMGAKVYTIERIQALYLKTYQLLTDMEYTQIQIYHMDGTLGLPEEAPYDRILVTAAAPKIPKIYLDQLKINGIMVVPVGSKSFQQMMKVTKTDENDYQTKAYESFRFVPLIGEEGWKAD
ncbi:MAG: protein-L-isoaspartate O-methyltransferase, partial [Bacteroidetes bacterium SW_10_40_5]